jgi:hypothetical protein
MYLSNEDTFEQFIHTPLYEICFHTLVLIFYDEFSVFWLRFASQFTPFGSGSAFRMRIQEANRMLIRIWIRKTALFTLYVLNELFSKFMVCC